MPHQCVRCSQFYDDGASEILKGCSCGGKLFFFVKNMKVREEALQLTDNDKRQIEDDVYSIIGGGEKPEEPVVLDLESVNVRKPGKFEIDLVRLFNKERPLVYKLEEGKYMIDIAATLAARQKK